MSRSETEYLLKKNALTAAPRLAFDWKHESSDVHRSSWGYGCQIRILFATRDFRTEVLRGCWKEGLVMAIFRGARGACAYRRIQSHVILLSLVRWAGYFVWFTKTRNSLRWYQLMGPLLKLMWHPYENKHEKDHSQMVRLHKILQKFEHFKATFPPATLLDDTIFILLFPHCLIFTEELKYLHFIVKQN